jgi:hypothetical protein
VDANAIHIEVTAEDGVTTRLYTVTVTRAAPQPSGNANLSNLVPSVGTLSPAFAAATLSYTVAVGNATASISFTPTAQDSGATIMVNGSTVASGSASQAIPLVVGANTATIHVTAADGVTAKTYTVVVSRAKPSISGTVNRTGGTDNPSAGAFLAVACVPVGSGTMGQVVISSGSFPLTYTIPDVDSGTYYVVAYFDANGDTELNAGDYYGENGSLVVVSSTSVTGVNVSIDILEDGPITVGLANASAINGKAVYFAIVEHYADPLEDPWLAGGTFVVTGGTGSAVGVDPDTGTPVAFIIGEIYDIYLLVDMNGNWGTLGGPDLGDLVGETTDYLFIYDDLPVYIDYSDLELYEP